MKEPDLWGWIRIYWTTLPDILGKPHRWWGDYELLNGK